MSNWKKIIALFLAGLIVVPTNLNALSLNVQAEGQRDYVSPADLQDNGTAAPEAWGALPNAIQYQYQKEELAAFCHFGMNTFTGLEWGSGKESPQSFALQEFDADGYVRALQEAGFKKVIVTARHHDGFCIWKSQYTEHDVESSPYQGDILEEISTACTKYDMDMGLYLSPWDANNKSYGYFDKDGNALCDAQGNPKDGMTWEEVEELDELDYNEYYDNQLIEILGSPKYGNNGAFNEVWMDGAKGSGSAAQNYDFVRWFNTIQKYEGVEAGRAADCMLFGAQAYTTVRWIGNELGFADEETWSKSKVDKEKNTINSNNVGSYTRGFPDGNQWTVPESDARITSGWFWGANKATPKSIDQLAEMYFRSVGHNSPLLLNVPPNNQGTVDDAILARLAEFGEAINKSFQNNQAAGTDITASEVRGNDVAFSPTNLLDGDDETWWTMEDGSLEGSIELDLGSVKTFDIVSIEEAIQLGQRISSYTVEYKNGSGEWQLFESGKTIGAKRLCRQSPVKADKLRITVSSEYAVPILSEVGIFKASKEFSVGNVVPEAVTVIDHLDKDVSDGNGFTYTGWNQETNPSYINGTGMWANAPAEATLTFTGTKAWLIGTKDPGHGKAEIYIDGAEQPSETIDTAATVRAVNVAIYETPTLTDGQHTIRIKGTTKALGIQGAYALNNGGRGMVQLDMEEYQVDEGEKVTVKLQRVGGTSGSMKVLLQDNPGSAVQSEYEPTNGLRIQFADGEAEKEATIQTLVNPAKTEDCEFYLEVVAAPDDENSAVGFIALSTVKIIDQTTITKAKLESLIETAKGKNSNHYLAEGYNVMLDALEAAEKTAARPNPSKRDIEEAYQALDAALAAMESRVQYTQSDPFGFPLNSKQNGLLEAEFFELDTAGAVNPEHYARIEENNKASNNKRVGWFENGNIMRLYYQAPRAGTYTVTATCFSGRAAGNPNKLNISGAKIESVSVPVYSYVNDTSGATPEETTFELVIKEAGEGVLEIAADASGGPGIDKFDIVPKELDLEKYTITATAGEGGSITDEGESQVTEFSDKTYQITPLDGYVITDVLVDGISVGAVTEYTFTEVTASATIEAFFEFNNYSAANPFVFSAAEKVLLEAEHFILEPISGDKYVRISTRDDASNGKEINWFEEGNKIRLPFKADKAGTYHVTATYRSGRNASKPNAFEWSGTNVSSGVQDVYGPDSSKFKVTEFDLEVAAAGVGELVFTASDKAGPVIDKFEIEYIQKVEAVELDKTEAELSYIGQTLQLTATVLPANAFNKTVTWTSTQPEIASVDQSGLVTVHAYGTATIMATSEDGGLTDACVITAAPVAVDGVTLDTTEATMTAAGEMLQLRAAVTPDNATNKSVSWLSSDPETATVEDGLVTAQANGTTTITVMTEDGSFTAFCQITVAIPEEVPVSGIELSHQSITLTADNNAMQLAAILQPENATNRNVTWSCEDESIAAVDQQGLVTAVADGETTVKAVTEDGGYEAECQVTVKLSVDPIAVTGVSLNQSRITLTGPGQGAQLVARIDPEDATNKTVLWDSDNETVVTVDQTGYVTAVSEGSAIVRVTTEEGEYTAECEVTVAETSGAVTGIYLDTDEIKFTEKGAAYRLTATVMPDDARTEVKWMTLDKSVATVTDDGTVTAAGNGTATILAITAEGGFAAACRVVVEIPPEIIKVTGVTLSKNQLEMDKSGQQVKLTAFINPDDATNKQILWTSTDDSVAAVDNSGTVTAAGNGSASIIASTADGGFVAICQVKVKIPPEIVIPGTVGSVKAGSEATDRFKLSWSAVSGAESYQIHIYSSRTRKWTTLTTQSTSMTVKGLSGGVRYTVQISAVNKAGSGPKSAKITTTTVPYKGVIRSLRKVSSSKVRLTYKKVNCSGYEIYMKTGSGRYRRTAITKKTSYTKTRLKKGVRYRFRIRSYVMKGSRKVYGKYSKSKSIVIR